MVILTYLPYFIICAACLGAIGIYGKNRRDAILFTVFLCALWFMYSQYGSSFYIGDRFPESMHSLFVWWGMQWNYGDLAYNWIMLPVAGYAIYARRKELLATPKSASFIGLAVVVVSIVVHVLAYRAQQSRISLVTLVGTVWGAAYALWGWQVARQLLFPAGYALLCFTGMLLVQITMSLRLIASGLAVALLRGINIQAMQQGTVLYSAAGGGFTFDVADACSGLRSLVVMTALAAPYAYFKMGGLWRKWALFLLSVPLAMLANTLRIVTLAMVAEFIGLRLAMSLYHDASGYLVFLFALTLLIGTGNLLNKDWKAIWDKHRRKSS